MSDVVEDLVEQVRHRVRISNSKVQLENVEIHHAVEDVIAESQSIDTTSDLTQTPEQR